MWSPLKKLWTAAEPTQPIAVTVYSREGCHLCDEACEILRRHGLNPTTVDIDLDPALQARYTDCVPVVVIEGQERFRGRVNEVLLRRLLRSSRKS